MPGDLGQQRRGVHRFAIAPVRHGLDAAEQHDFTRLVDIGTVAGV